MTVTVGIAQNAHQNAIANVHEPAQIVTQNVKDVKLSSVEVAFLSAMFAIVNFAPSVLIQAVLFVVKACAVPVAAWCDVPTVGISTAQIVIRVVLQKAQRQKNGGE
jgi:hypothetical protein